MKLALFGATGTIGSRIFAEAVARGHEVTVVLRDPARAPAAAHAVERGDVTDARDVARAIGGHDAVVSAVGGMAQRRSDIVVEAARAFVAALPQAGVRRLLVVGGAGALLTATGERIMDRPQFPEAWKPAAEAQLRALDVYRSEADELEWTYVAPADVIEPGERTGRFVLDVERAVFGADGESRISAEDLAVALIDELERPAHVRGRFTLGYA